MIHFNSKLLSAVVLAASVVYGQVGRADVLALYNFNGSTVGGSANLASSDTNASSSAQAITLGSGFTWNSPQTLTGVSPINAIYANVTGTISGTTNAFLNLATGAVGLSNTTITTATSGNRFFEFLISPVNGSDTINLTDLTFTWGMNNTNNTGPPNGFGLMIGSSLISSGTVLRTTAGAWGSPSTVFTFDLTGSSVAQNLTGTTSVRLYIYNPTPNSSQSTRSLSIDNITLNGVVVPEPGTLMLAGLGISSLIPFAMRRLRGRKSLAGDDGSSSDESDPGALGRDSAESL